MWLSKRAAFVGDAGTGGVGRGNQVMVLVLKRHREVEAEV